MLKILKCRRSSIAVLCLVALTFLGYKKGAEVAAAIATIALGVAGANAFEKRGSKNALEK
jgi:hypothetical protein